MIKRFENFDWSEEDFDYEDESPLNIPDDLFKKFLIDNNIYDEFIYEFNNYYRNQNSDMKEFIESSNFISYISNAFSWGNTNKGFKYWDTLNKKWKKLLGKSVFIRKK